jgi:hypothetical protein
VESKEAVMKRRTVVLLAMLAALGILIAIPAFAGDRPKSLKGKSRGLHVLLSSTATVEVYEGEKLVFKYNGKKSSKFDGHEVDVAIPPYADCEVRITATEDGHMTYIAAEEAYGRPAYRSIIYSKVEMQDGEVFTGWFPAYEAEDYDLVNEGTSLAYTLVGPSGEEFEAIEGDYETMLCKFKYSTNDKALGIVIPVRETSLLGKVVAAQALPSKKGVFEGWYEDGVKIEDAEELYKFEAETDRELEARFTEKESDGDTETVKSSKSWPILRRGSAWLR